MTNLVPPRLKHGGACNGKRSVEWKAWWSAIVRCTYPSQINWKYYGGRGIDVCLRWRQSYEAFLEDMGPCPPGLTLDRFPDKDGNYEPGNCRWAPWLDQVNNRRSNRVLTFQGESRSVAEWCRQLNLLPYVVGRRLRNGWSVEDALTRAGRYAGVRANV